MFWNNESIRKCKKVDSLLGQNLTAFGYKSRRSVKLGQSCIKYKSATKDKPGWVFTDNSARHYMSHMVVHSICVLVVLGRLSIYLRLSNSLLKTRKYETIKINLQGLDSSRRSKSTRIRALVLAPSNLAPNYFRGPPRFIFCGAFTFPLTQDCPLLELRTVHQ